MNKINILYGLGIAVLLALLMIYKSVETQKRIAEAAAENTRMEQLGKSLSTMKADWKDAKQMQQRIDSLLENSAFKQYVSKKEQKQNVFRVQIDNIPAKVFDRFTSKLLNETIAVKQLQVTRKGDQNASITLELFL